MGRRKGPFSGWRAATMIRACKWNRARIFSTFRFWSFGPEMKA